MGISVMTVLNRSQMRSFSRFYLYNIFHLCYVELSNCPFFVEFD